MNTKFTDIRFQTTNIKVIYNLYKRSGGKVSLLW